MITKEEARTITLENIQTVYADQLANLDAQVRQAAAEGKLDIDINEVLDEPLQSYLILELGYIISPKVNYVTSEEVENNLTYNYQTNISWSDSCANKTIC